MIALVQTTFSTQFGQFLIEPSQLQLGSPRIAQALCLIDLDQCPHDARASFMPACPVIGLGDTSHPLAPFLDTVAEPPISVAALIKQIEQAPLAAAATVQLLRSLEGTTRERALTLESLCYGLLQGSAEHARWLAARTSMASPVPPGIIIVERNDAVLHVLLDRPLARNAIDRNMRDQLFEAFTVASLDPEIRAVKLRATGNVFSMGGDLDEFGTTRDPATAHLIRSQTLPARALLSCVDKFDVHVQGACVGAGLELAAFAKRFTATSAAWFQLPELSMGLIPGAGGCVSVPRRIGRQRAALLMLSGRRITAATALRWGLIDAIEDSATLNERGAHHRTR